jgi:hypothetical protein
VSDWIAVLGTLAGTIVGSASTYINQRFQARQAARTQLEDARRATYADFLTQTHNIYLQFALSDKNIKTKATRQSMT